MSIFKTHISAMSAYAPPLEGRDASSHLLLDFNERTLPVSRHIQQALVDYVQSGRLQMYPAYGNITERLAEYCGVAAAQVMITNGSDQGIDLVFRSVCREGDEVIIPGPSFAMYNQCAGIENLKVIEPAYRRDQGFPLAEVLAAITERTKLIVIANPNNPCGSLLSVEDIIRVAKAAPQAAILVDECYYEYTRVTVADRLEQFPNLVVTRTFSKTWGMPSLRFGYVLSAMKNIQALLNVRGPYDINQMAVVAAQAALDHPADTDNYVREVMDQAKPALEAFLQRQGVPFWKSAANFVWLFPENAEAIAEFLAEKNILVRPKHDVDGQLGLRITIGTVEQTLTLIAALQQALEP